MKTITIAGHELSGGTKDKPVTVRAGEQVSDATLKALGIDADAAEALLARGALVEVPVHVDENAGGSKAAKKLTERAATAEAEVATLKARVTELEAELAKLTPAA